MAACEHCGKGGFTTDEMHVDKAREIFIGPCCVKVLPAPPPDTAPEYGFEASNKVGVRAYAEYGGLRVEFNRSPSEIKKFFEES